VLRLPLLDTSSDLKDSKNYVTIEATQTGSSVVLKIAGRMDAESAEDFDQACASWADRGVSKMVLDLSELTYVSSMGLRSLVLTAKLMQSHNGTLRLCGVSGFVQQILEITRLNTVFTISESVDAALADA
jgi:anti-sigma B factor antagonist